MDGKRREAVMTAVDIVLPAMAVRRWQIRIAERLIAEGHNVRLLRSPRQPHSDASLDGLLRFERLLPGARAEGLWSREEPRIENALDRPADIVIDLAVPPGGPSGAVPTLTILFHGRADLANAAGVLSRGVVPEIELHLDGVEVAHAAPMAASRVFVSRGLDCVLARAVTLMVAFVRNFDASTVKRLRAHEHVALEQPETMGQGLVTSYAFSTIPRLVGRALKRLRYYGGHWKVGYRFVDGPGVAETRSLAGTPWTVLPDPGDRFYADPFPIKLNGRYFVFVEELVHAKPKGVISVSECGSHGELSRPTPVLKESFHLSYPQVFTRDGEIWMIPETADSRQLVLYRAVAFPHRWEKERVLIANRELFDATLLDHDGLYWLFATERDGDGDPSDTMVVFFAESLQGPWQPHPRNPIVIDKRASRPGGRFVRLGNEVLLPLQDGTEFYGCGLGLSQLVRLDVEAVELSQPTRIDARGYWPYPHIHTLNRDGRLETIDGFTASERRKLV